jgi:hypothetical protein
MARRDADERLDVLMKDLFQDETVITGKTAKSINATGWNSVPDRLRIERFFCIPISENTGVEIKHFDAVSDRECHWINLKVSRIYAQKHPFVIICIYRIGSYKVIFLERDPGPKKKNGLILVRLYCRTVEV